jgi:hypothetical protein
MLSLIVFGRLAIIAGALAAANFVIEKFSFGYVCEKKIVKCFLSEKNV